MKKNLDAGMRWLELKGVMESSGNLTVVTKKAEETKELGVMLGKLLVSGDLLFLSGDLGSGKTLFVRGITKGLNSVELATSPTFSLIHRYEGDLPLYHLDLYRLRRQEELRALALEEILEEEAAVVLEWGDLAKENLPSDFLEVFFQRAEKDNSRRLIFSPQGERYQELIRRLMNHADLGD